MKKNKLAFKLIDMGLRAETLANLTESQLRLLYNKLNEGKKETKEVQQITTTKIVATPEEVKKGVSTQGKSMAKQLPDGKFEFTENKKKSKKYNPFAICASSVGRKDKEKYERCVMGVKESIKEGKDPVNLFLEEKIVSLLEKHVQPKISKRDFLQMISETETAPAKPKEKEKEKERKGPFNPKPGVKPAPKAGETETAPSKPKEKQKEKERKGPFNPKPGVKPAPKAGKESLPDLLKWDNLGLNF